MIWKKTLTIAMVIFVLASQAMVSICDAQTASAQFKVYPLRYVEPGDASRMLRDLLGENAHQARIVADDSQKELLVSGSAEVHQLASQLVKQLNQPKEKPRSVFASKPTPVLRSYVCLPDKIQSCALRVEKFLGASGKISIDANRSRIIVVASEADQKLVPQIISSAVQETNRSLPTAFQNKPFVAPRQSAPYQTKNVEPLFPGQPQFRPQTTIPDLAIPTRSRSIQKVTSTGISRQIPAPLSYQFKNISAAQCQRALTKLLGNNFTKISDQHYAYSQRNSGTVLFQFDSQFHRCVVDGPDNLTPQLATLVQKLDESQARKQGESVRFIPLENINPQVLQQAIRLWRESSEQKSTQQKQQSRFEPPSSNIHQTAFFQDKPVDTQTKIPVMQNPVNVPNGENLKRPSSDVTVESLPDLDLLILRGRDPDIEELTRIIQEIERLSSETAPQIELIRLKHVHGESLNTLITTVLTELTGPLQGRISITPLIKPNALLLIGWGEAVKAAKKLIAELDQPILHQTQMHIFSLKNAPAQEVQTTIEQFLNGRGGLGPNVNVTANPRTNSVIVNASPRDLKEVAALVAKLDAGTSESVNQAKIIKLKNSLAADVAQTITAAITAAKGGGAGKRNAALEMLLVDPTGKKVMASGLLDDVTLTPAIRTNSIFVTGPAKSLPLVEQLIRSLDESTSDNAQIKIYQIANGDASDLVSVLRTLFPDAGTSTVPQLATAKGESSMVPVRFSVEVRTNSIIATGAAGDLKIIEALLLRLDESESQERINKVFKLKNSPAVDVARAVNDFLRSERIVAQAAPGRANPFRQIEQEVVVVPEAVGNSLIISATPRYFDQIIELVEDLDKQPPQVMIQVILAEVELDNLHEFGVELGLQDSLLFDRSLLGDLLTTTTTTILQNNNGIQTTTQDNVVGASNAPGFDFNNNLLGNSGSTQAIAGKGNVGGQGLSHFSLGRVNGDLDYGGLVLSASSANVSMLLRALEQSKSLEILSRPQIMTLDNQPAFIQVGQRVPRIVGTQLNQTGQVNSIEMENVGLILGVTPRISPDGNVVMEIDAEKSELGLEQDGIPVSVSASGAVIRSPRVNITTAQTTVSAASGQTIVIGGLISSSNTSFTRKVPWLGDIPVLGRLFRYDGSSNKRKELLIILTPYVVRGESEAEYIKQLEVSRISWVTSDVFNWMGSGSDLTVPFDDAGIEIYYPDDNPGVGSSHIREPEMLTPQNKTQFENPNFSPMPVPEENYSSPQAPTPRLPMLPNDNRDRRQR